MLSASDLQTDFIFELLIEPDISDDPDIEPDIFDEPAIEPVILETDLLLSSMYVFVFTFIITFGSPGEQRALVVLASAEPFFIPVA